VTSSGHMHNDVSNDADYNDDVDDDNDDDHPAEAFRGQDQQN